MALVDDLGLGKVVDSIDKLAKDGVPLKLEHTIDSVSIWQMIGGFCGVALVLVVLLGIKDVVVHRITKT